MNRVAHSKGKQAATTSPTVASDHLADCIINHQPHNLADCIAHAQPNYLTNHQPLNLAHCVTHNLADKRGWWGWTGGEGGGKNGLSVCGSSRQVERSGDRCGAAVRHVWPDPSDALGHCWDGRLKSTKQHPCAEDHHRGAHIIQRVMRCVGRGLEGWEAPQTDFPNVLSSFVKAHPKSQSQEYSALTDFLNVLSSFVKAHPKSQSRSQEYSALDSDAGPVLPHHHRHRCAGTRGVDGDDAGGRRTGIVGLFLRLRAIARTP